MDKSVSEQFWEAILVDGVPNKAKFDELFPEYADLYTEELADMLECAQFEASKKLGW